MTRLPDRSLVHPTDFGCLRLLDVRRGLCASICIVLSRLEKLAAIALIVAVVTTTGSTLLAQCAQHDAYAMRHQECDHAAMVTQYCGHASDASIQGEPVASRVQLTVVLSPHPVALATGTFIDASRTSPQFHTSPPSVSSPDLATRFAPLLI